MSSDEMKNNVETLTRLTHNLEAARDELERLNQEETLFKWEQSDFPQLNTMFALKEPYEKLWVTAYNFHQKNETWMNGNNFCFLSHVLSKLIQCYYRTLKTLRKKTLKTFKTSFVFQTAAVEINAICFSPFMPSKN
jgi:dynein heavy chain